jgi:hypothetical protein
MRGAVGINRANQHLVDAHPLPLGNRAARVWRMAYLAVR